MFVFSSYFHEKRKKKFAESFCENSEANIWVSTTGEGVEDDNLFSNFGPPVFFSQQLSSLVQLKTVREEFDGFLASFFLISLMKLRYLYCSIQQGSLKILVLLVP